MGNILKALDECPKGAVIALWAICSTILVAIIIITINAVKIWKRSKYTWLVGTLLMLVVGDACLIWANWGYALQLNETYTVNHLLSIKLSIGVGTGLFNLLQNWFHWEFGFEYWYVSIEMARYLS